MKRLIKKILKALGYEVHKTSGYRRSLRDSLEHLKAMGFSPKTCIDVGVAYGTQDLYEAFSGSKFILIEPLEEYEYLMKDVKNNYTAEYLVAAASDRDGEIEFYVHPDLAGSSTLKQDAYYGHGTRRKVPAVKVDSVCKKFNTEGPILIKIDVQGSELKVVAGINESAEDVEVIILEVSTFEFHHGEPQFAEVIARMKERGYVAYDIADKKYRPLDNALSQVDIIFVKEGGMFRKNHRFASDEGGRKFVREMSRLNPK